MKRRAHRTTVVAGWFVPAESRLFPLRSPSGFSTGTVASLGMAFIGEGIVWGQAIQQAKAANHCREGNEVKTTRQVQLESSVYLAGSSVMARAKRVGDNALHQEKKPLCP